MKIYLDKNVYEAAIERINYIFDEFKTVLVGISGGKDSTVVFNLVMQVAKERGRLPLKVYFIDEEAEWPWTVEMVRSIMYRKDVEPYWYQIPVRIDNATSYKDKYLYCWKPGDEWLREKEPIAITENNYGLDKWEGLFNVIFQKDFEGQDTVALSGVRVEESTKRYLWMNTRLVYKDISWGTYNGLDKKGGKHYTLFPIYDWSYTDVWKAIYENKWEYNKVYDYFYNYGVSVTKMRVSNLHHENSFRSLFILQEIAPELYEKLIKRLNGIDMAGKLNVDSYFPDKLPFMFSTWKDYRDYLVEHIVDEEYRDTFIKKFEDLDFKSQFMKDPDYLVKREIESILLKDNLFNHLNNVITRPEFRLYYLYVMGEKELEDIHKGYDIYLREDTHGKLREALRNRECTSN